MIKLYVHNSFGIAFHHEKNPCINMIKIKQETDKGDGCKVFIKIGQCDIKWSEWVSEWVIVV
jgi:hypothetical protein